MKYHSDANKSRPKLSDHENFLTKSCNIKGDKKMNVKVYMPTGYKIVTVKVYDDVKRISEKFMRWEYVL